MMQDEEHDDAKLPAEDLGESVDSTVATADKSDNKECRAVDRNKNNESMPDRRHFLVKWWNRTRSHTTCGGPGGNPRIPTTRAF